MNNKAVKVGDVVAWDDVPNGALVLESDDFYSQRINDHGSIAALKGDVWRARDDISYTPWRWAGLPTNEVVTIIALGLTGNETADDLRALAEAFEREHPARDA